MYMMESCIMKKQMFKFKEKKSMKATGSYEWQLEASMWQSTVT